MSAHPPPPSMQYGLTRISLTMIAEPVKRDFWIRSIRIGSKPGTLDAFEPA